MFWEANSCFSVEEFNYLTRTEKILIYTDMLFWFTLLESKNIKCLACRIQATKRRKALLLSRKKISAYKRKVVGDLLPWNQKFLCLKTGGRQQLIASSIRQLTVVHFYIFRLLRVRKLIHRTKPINDTNVSNKGKHQSSLLQYSVSPFDWTEDSCKWIENKQSDSILEVSNISFNWNELKASLSLT